MKISLVFLLLSLVLFVNSNDIRDLEPKAFWRPFYDISQIPHCSKKEGRLREDYVKKFAQHFNYKYRQDSYGNAVVEVPARPGKEGKPKLVLQSHLDMVCEKNRGSTHDFDKDPLQLLFSPQDRDWIIANETTLGADDAAGMALSIGLTTDPLAIHGPLELLFTVEEEIGLVGATNLQPGDFVTGTILINIDSGTQGQLTIGCAGGMRVEMDYQEKTTAIRPGQVIYEIYVKGLVGGHSGKDIDAGKGNSIKILGRILNAIVDSNIDFNIVNLSAGTSSNAIPRESSAQIAIVEGDAQRVASIVAKLTDVIKSELVATEPTLFSTFGKINTTPSTVYDAELTRRIIYVIQIGPHGVVEMSRQIPGLVETSLNFAVLASQNGVMTLTWTIRSSIDTAKENVAATLRAIASITQGKVRVLSDYNGWRPNLTAPIIEKSKVAYKKLFGVDPVVKAIHAGLEPGIIGVRYPQLAGNMISMGPNIIGNHSPTEKMQISSVDKTYKWVRELVNQYAK